MYFWPCYVAVGGGCRSVGIVRTFFFGEYCSWEVHMRIALDKMQECKGSISSSSFSVSSNCWTISHIFYSHNYPEDEELTD